MYFWNIKQLKSELKKNKLSEASMFGYVMAINILISIAIISLNLTPSNKWTLYDAINQGIIGIIGTYYLYKCNGGRNGQNFLQNYIAIGWVCSVRWFVIFFLPLLIIYSSFAAYYFGISDETTLDAIIFYGIMSILLYLYIGKHIKSIAKK